jgi:hypothetical protein
MYLDRAGAGLEIVPHPPGSWSGKHMKYAYEFEQLMKWSSLAPGTNILFGGPDFSIDKVADFPLASNTELWGEALYPPRFRGILQASAKPGVNARLKKKLFFAEGRTSVAMHIRRGDAVHDGCRVTSDAWYLAVANVIKRHVPNADIHIFTEGKNSLSKHGFSVHGEPGAESMLDATAHFVAADILVTARSSFSNVPAMFNPNCIIFQHYWGHALPGYIELRGEVGDGDYNSKLYDFGRIPVPVNIRHGMSDVDILERELPACIQKGK